MPAETEILRIYISPGHNFFGRHGQPAGTNETVSVPSVECVAGQGLMGDRFFGHKENYKGQVTFFAWEIFEDICRAVGVTGKEPDVLRRNVITRGVDLNTLIGKEFEIQGITFEGMSECSPCYWMNQAVGEGAEEALRGRGGLRARILTDGLLKVTAS